MKIFKKPFKKAQLGSSTSHDPGRSNEIPPPSSSSSSSSPSPSPSALSPSCGSDHRAAAAAAAAATLAAPSTAESPRPAAAGDRSDYYSSEEEFQVQLALALSASNSDFRGDPDGDQIRAATLLSLGRQRLYQTGEEEGTAEWLSRRYWDYNVLDYNEKVVDGFYDIFGLSSDPASQGKMPALLDLQTGIGDLGFEVIVVNRAIDPSLVELEQIAQCISLDSPAAQVALLVQRVSELVTEHMGGPVRDANDMLTKWMEKSSELRTSLQTSLLPIGCIKVGLSRHRALLFKVLADNVGIPCRLVKGSHYTGVDDDAINIIKLDNEREFLVDLMAAPGTLIPADVLSAKDASLGSYNPRLNNSLTPWATNNSGDGLLRMKPSWSEYKGNSGIFGTSAANDYNAMDKESRYEKAVLLPPVPIAHSRATSANAGSSSSGNRSMFRLDQANYSSSSTSATSSKQKEVLEVPVDGDHSMNEKLNISPNSQDPVDSKYLFAELNPFHAVGVGKTSAQFKASDNKNTEYQRRRENIPSGPGRPQLPLVWKNRSPCNEVPNTKQSNFGEEPYPRKNVGVKDLNASSSSHPSSQAVKIHSECPNSNVTGISSISYSPGICTSGNEMNETSTGNTGCPSSRVNSSSIDSGSSQDSNLDNGYVFVSTQPSEENNREENHTTELKEQRKNVNGKHDMKKGTQDRFMKPNTTSKDSESSTSQLQAMASRLDPMLDDVAEWEIPWEDLVIGERIGLGSYGEVYRADWNGTVAHGSSDSGIVTLSTHAHDEHSFQGISAKEVAVKKFLDQDFYGDALDEFRSEVRIMRRLRHPNVVLFMGAVTRPPNLSIVSEFLPRGSLYRILHRPNCQIDEKRRIKMALDVAKGMNCLHASMPTIVHRDLKSPNLLVDKNWTVKVCDFGLSRLKHNTFLSSKSTAGTPEWMAPEVLRNEPSNEKCDVYSFGVILWELATLRMPWSGMNPMQVVGAVGFQDRRLDIPKEVDPIVARIIWECWQKDPSLRPSFAQLTTALKSLQRLAIPSHQETHSPPLTQEISVNSTP